MNITRALVVDDSKTARISLKKQLQNRGIEVDVAESGEEALSYLRSCEPLYPDIIFMDIMMPGIDGLEATKTITSTPETSTIPVVMCTSKDDEQTKIAAQENGAIGFAVKPIKGDELEKSLQMASEQIAELDQALDAADMLEPEVGSAIAASGPVTLSAHDIEAITEQVTTLANRIASEVAEDIASKVTKTTSYLAIAQAKQSAEEIAAKSAKAIAIQVSEKEASEHAKATIEQMTGQLVQQTVREEVEKARANIQADLASHMTAYLKSAQVSAEMQNSVQDKATHTAKTVAQQMIKDSERRSEEIAHLAAKSAVGGIKVLTYLFSLTSLGIIGYLAAQALGMLNL
ncbi:MAG: response regulator [Methylococcales bacterium]|jgi:CheY-like chemotaxis protein|nr:response regulator [Methylococcales bacterium]